MPAGDDRAGMQTIAAKNYRKGRLSSIRLIVIHDMEAPEGPLTAENVAKYFRDSGVVASAHICVDNDSAVRCVPDEDTAYAAPGANTDGLQLEIAGYMRQSRDEWLDAYSKAALGQAARATAAWCAKYGIPVRRLTRDELRAGVRGITCHADVSAVYKRSDHTDPGPGFPWDWFLAMVHEARNATTTAPPLAETPVPVWPGRYFTVKNPPMRGTDIAVWQRQMRQRGWSIVVDSAYARADADIARAFQSEKGLVADGVVGPITWEAAWASPII